MQSRYYDPTLRRFVNADGLTATGQGFIGNNMFAYCLNNPVNREDATGMISLVNERDLLGAYIGAFWYPGMFLIESIMDLVLPSRFKPKSEVDTEPEIEETQPSKPKNGKKQPSKPKIEYPGDDPTKAPGEDYEWRGKQPVGGNQGAWVNRNTGEQWHPDFNHGNPKGPHWDYTDVYGIKWTVTEEVGRTVVRLWKNGKIVLEFL